MALGANAGRGGLPAGCDVLVKVVDAIVDTGAGIAGRLRVGVVEPNALRNVLSAIPESATLFNVLAGREKGVIA